MPHSWPISAHRENAVCIQKHRQLAVRKKALYLEYRKAQQDMRELVAVKGSVDHLRGLMDNQRNKEQAR